MSVGLFRWSTTNRRIAKAVERVHAQIDERAAEAVKALATDVFNARLATLKSFLFAARSLGQQRRRRARHAGSL